MGYTLHEGDCIDVLRGLPAASVGAICTDPPSGTAFMDREWDRDKGGRDQWIAWLAGILAECFRVLKPGGYALVWAFPRTSHWTGMAIEDAGFRVVDSIHHLFGSGFPKSLAIDKAVDRAAGAERERVRPVAAPARNGDGTNALGGSWQDEPWETAPATDLARQWAGYGTALKPAHEVWWLAQKPMEGTYAANVARHGVGGLAIDACRVGSAPAFLDRRGGTSSGGIMNDTDGERVTSGGDGRWPPNLLLTHHPDCRPLGTRRVRVRPNGGSHAGTGAFPIANPDPVGYADADGLETVAVWDCVPGCPVAILDAQSGTLTSGQAGANGHRRNVPGFARELEGRIYGNGEGLWTEAGPAGELYGDSGGASRFYPTFRFEDEDFAPFLYVAKAARSERDHGLQRLGVVSAAEMTGRQEGSAGLANPRAGTRTRAGARNHHPTVKPLQLMRWLVRLITPPGETVLDPFAGSGTTGCAALTEGRDVILIEREPAYIAICRRRLETTQPGLPLGAD